MLIISKNGKKSWVHEFTCTRCKSILGMEKTDIHYGYSDHKGTHLSVECVVCHNWWYFTNKEVPIPKNILNELKINHEAYLKTIKCGCSNANCDGVNCFGRDL